MPYDGQRRTQIASDAAAVARWDDEGGGHSRASAQVAAQAKGNQGYPAHSKRSVGLGAQILSKRYRDPE
jgi:hypothetical protein